MKLRSLVLGLLAVGLVGSNLMLVRSVHTLSDEMAQLRSEVATHLAPATPRMAFAVPNLAHSAAEPLDEEALAAGIARRLGTSSSEPQAEPPSPEPAPSAEAAKLTQGLIAPYLNRRNLSVSDWQNLARQLGQIPAEQKEGVVQEIMAAINRQELVPPAGISFLRTLLSPEVPAQETPKSP